MNLFKTKLRYQKMMEDGVEKTVTGEYLVDAISWSEAESRIIEEMKPFISGEFSITDISKFKVAEVFLNDSGDYYYKVKLNFISLDEKSGSEKKTSVYMLVNAKTIEEAREIVVSEMKKSMMDYTIQKIEETNIIDLFQYPKE